MKKDIELHPFIKYPGGKTKEIPLVIKYMPKKVVESLTVAQFATIVRAWSEETKKVSGVTPGES